MWSYYGSKTNIVDYYPKPKHDLIIEPFAGAAKYSLKYFDRNVLLVDKYDVIIKIFKWLQKCSTKDVLSLPRHIKPNETLNDFTFDCEEAKWLMGFLIKKGVERPATKPTAWAVTHRPNFTNFSLQRIAADLPKIRHWQFLCADYTDIPNQKATWFIDPPYQDGGHSYVHSNKKINFTDLGEWCKDRQGQVIVCESAKADWLDFKPLVECSGRTGMQKEGVWVNDNSFNTFQTQLNFTL